MSRARGRGRHPALFGSRSSMGRARCVFERPTVAAVLSTAFAIGICGVILRSPAAADSEVITIGAVLPLSGEAAHWGIPPRNGAQLAIDQINAAGGIGGRKLQLLVEAD